ncbi:MAG: 30S ribosomal protein S16 [Thermostichus sp. BF3_bins_97]
MVKLRLKRYGKKRQPSYRIIAIESKTRREARPLEELGYYNPRTKETVLETGGLLKWLRYGAQPTETLEAILKKAGIYEMMKAGEDGVVASIRIPAIAKPEVGIPEEAEESVTEELAVAADETEADDVAEAAEDTEPALLAEAPESTSDEPVAEVAAVAEPETAQPTEEEPVVAEEETSEEPKVEEAAEA